MQVVTKLTEILAIKANIKSAIQAKGVTIGDDVPFSQYPAKIGEIVTADPAQGQAKLSYTATAALIEKLVYPSGSTSVPASNLRGLPMVEAILPEGIVSLGDYAFADCIFLTKVNCPLSMRTMGSYVFAGSGMVSLTIPNFITSLGVLGILPYVKDLVINANIATFLGAASCPKLETVQLAANIKAIPNDGMRANPLLKNINLESVETLGSYCFYNCPQLVAANLTALKTMGTYCFQLCTNLETVIIGPNLTHIPGACFIGTTKLKKLSFPNVGSIDQSAIGDCSALETIEFLSSSLTVRASIISNCNVLKALVIHATTVPAMLSGNTQIIYGTTVTNKTLKIYVRDELLESYKTASGWQLFDASMFYPLSTYVAS